MNKCEKGDLNQDEEEEEHEYRHSWMGFFGFFILLSETGVRQVMNVFVPSLMVEYKCSKLQADTAAIITPSASSLMAGPLAAFIYQLVGARISICAGSALCFAGFMLGSYADGIFSLYIYGLLIGVGCALMRNSIISVQCEYFTKYRNFVMSFISIGPGIGIWLLPRVIMPLINATSWKLAWKVLAVMYVICFVMGLFISRRSKKRVHSCADLLGITVWKQYDFILHAMASFCASSVCVIYLSNILDLMRSENIPQPETVYSYQGVASIIGRTILTLLMLKVKIHIAILMIFNYVIAQSSLFSALFCYSLWQFRAQNFFSGIGIGMFQATLAPFLLQIVGPSQLPAALGYTNLINGLAAFAGVRIAGSVVKAYNSPRRAFVVAIFTGCLAMLFSIINSVYILLKDRKRRKPTLTQMSNVAEIQALQHIGTGES